MGCAIVALGSFAGAGWLAWRRHTQETTARAQAAVRADLAGQLKERRHVLETAARAAAAIPQLRAALRQGVDPATITDLFEDEDWWQPFRGFANVVVVGGRAVVSRGELPDARVIDELVIAASRGAGAASLMVAREKPLVLAAARLSERDAVIVLGEPGRAEWRELEKTPPAPPLDPPWPRWFAIGAGLAALGGTLLPRRAGARPAPATASSPGLPAAPITGPAGAQAATQMAAGQAQPFGRYTLIDRIGEGGMAEIFLASMSGAEGFSRLLVVKRLKPDLVLNPAAVAQFIDEAKLGSQMVHSNIVTITDFGKIGDGYFLAEEYFAGRNLFELANRLRERGAPPLSMALVFFIAHEVLSGLAYAHDLRDDDGVRLNVVHRDVSPTNVMVSREGEVKLLDFGIVKADTRVARTDSGSIKGNAGYMSPEQARGKEVDGRSDLFSLGLVLFDLLAGDTFYQGTSTGEILYQAATGPTADHLSRLRQLSEPAASILQKALALDPAARFPDAHAFAAHLAPYLVGAKVQLAALVKSMFGDELAQAGVAARATRTSNRHPRDAA